MKNAGLITRRACCGFALSILWASFAVPMPRGAVGLNPTNTKRYGGFMQTITIEFVTTSIYELGLYSGWRVAVGEKFCQALSWDEMLGLVAALTMPEGERPCTGFKLRPNIGPNTNG